MYFLRPGKYTYNERRNKLLSEKTSCSLVDETERDAAAIHFPYLEEHHFSLSLTHNRSSVENPNAMEQNERLCFIFSAGSTSCQIQNPEAAEGKCVLGALRPFGRAPINFYDVARAKPEPSWRQIIATSAAHKLVGRSEQLISDILPAVLLFTADAAETNFCTLNLAAVINCKYS